MVINDFNVFRVPVIPDKTYTVLVVYPDTMLAAPVTVKGFKPVAGRAAQVVKPIRCIKNFQFSSCCLLDSLEFFDRVVIK